MIWLFCAALLYGPNLFDQILTCRLVWQSDCAAWTYTSDPDSYAQQALSLFGGQTICRTGPDLSRCTKGAFTLCHTLLDFQWLGSGLDSSQSRFDSKGLPPSPSLLVSTAWRRAFEWFSFAGLSSLDCHLDAVQRARIGCQSESSGYYCNRVRFPYLFFAKTLMCFLILIH